LIHATHFLDRVLIPLLTKN